MKRTIITAIAALAAGLAQPANAQEAPPLIAGLVEPVAADRAQAMRIELYDQALEKGRCKGAPGGRWVRMVSVYPTVSHHSAGCWRVAGDTIVLMTWTLAGKEHATTRPIEDFKKTPLFVSWEPAAR